MKKFVLFVGASVLAVSSLLYACKKGEKILPENSEYDYFEKFAVYGEVHNMFMENVKNNLNIDGKVNSVSEVVDYVHTVHQNFLKEIDLEEDYKSELSQSLDKHKDFIMSDKFYESTFLNSNGRIQEGSDTVSFFEAIEMVKAKGLIDEFEYLSLKELSKTVRESYEGNISDTELKDFVNNLKQSWVKRGYDDNSEHGKILAIALSISLSSIEWWEANPDAGFYDPRGRTYALPGWAALDISGTVITATSSALIQYGVNGSVNWEIVGWSAVGGAILGSTGAVSELAKVISKVL